MPKEYQKSLQNLKIAVGHDDLTVPFEGGGKVFSAIAEVFPQADVFTSMGTKERLAEFADRRVLTTFMQKLPFKRKLQLPLAPLYPLAFESLDLTDYDLVITSSSRFAHGVLTKPETTHICYMHSPGRMFWEPERYFQDKSWLGKLLTPALSYLRLWDYTAAQRVDYFIANSQNIAKKIKRYYGREAKVIYPFVDLARFQTAAEADSGRPGDYFLIVTRLAPWKRVDIAVEAAKQAGVNLKIVGAGPDRRRLKKMVKAMEEGEGKIETLGGVGDEEVNTLYRNCRAFIMTQEEDFGITALEAQAMGKPVIAYGAGGALEMVVEGETGEFFKEQTASSLAEVLRKFKAGKYRAEDCRANAERFSKERFQREILKFVEETLKTR
ncbi:MAG: Glycosyl transferase group 1 [candidate division CPR1 bacterium GW2011_GWC1_49_13]|uniref:Glycosyl transferase group 1 n=1 Tax=candidate division CPR1 bacterium GW2011_GWC1_49_13 TaxID=1618342 RepID=A0A0G1VH09_9BACT|nr:MAG: Glycosyl transferase group 1 [candidate division CPR1 bacterium GW2011_GWC1_49_13]